MVYAYIALLLLPGSSMHVMDTVVYIDYTNITMQFLFQTLLKDRYGFKEKHQHKDTT